MYQLTPLQMAYALTGWEVPTDGDEVSRYAQAVRFFDQLVAEAARRDVTVHDRLEAQSITWAITRWELENWREDLRAGIARYRTGAAVEIAESGGEAHPAGETGPRRIVKIAPGEQGKYWDDCVNNGYMCVGWELVGDLTQFGDAAAYKEAFAAAYQYPSPSQITTKSRELWTLRELRPGDVVVANRGIDEILGVGTVRAPGYAWRPDRGNFNHTVGVDWDLTGAGKVEARPYWAFRTVLDLTEDELAALLDRSLAQPVAVTVRQAVAAAGLTIASETIDDIYLALRTKPFLILTGLSGTGKTQVAMRLCELLCERANWELVAVRPDWTDSRGLLGYLNLLTDRYQMTLAMRLLLKAYLDWRDNGPTARLYGLILDEMNLARVEYYFADVLSAMETRRLNADGEVESEPLSLHDRPDAVSASGDESLGVPGHVRLPPNLFVIGTVNVDETTQPFSKKVLDRANTIELFDVDLTLDSSAAVETPAPAARERVRRHFGRDGAFIDLTRPELDQPWLDLLIATNRALEPFRLHFGYRIRNEILAFINQAGEEELLGSGEAAKWRAADMQIMQKVLPRLAGSREQLQGPLLALLRVAAGGSAQWIDQIGDRYEELYARLSVGIVDEASNLTDAAHPGGDDTQAIAAGPLRLPRTAPKIARMLVELKRIGYASFFE